MLGGDRQFEGREKAIDHVERAPCHHGDRLIELLAERSKQMAHTRLDHDQIRPWRDVDKRPVKIEK